MGFSEEWDELYKGNKQLSIWPFTDLVSYVMRYAKPSNKEVRVLELGCGAGANIPFFKSLEVEYYAMEGSHTMVKRLWERFPEFRKNIIVGDFTKEIPFPGEFFNLVVDRSSLTHNTTSAIKKCSSLIYETLKPDGKFIGIDWFSTLHSDYKNGVIDEDVYTMKNYTAGQFAHVGCVHFSNKQHLIELFVNFNIEIMEHKTVRREIPKDDFVFASWNLVAKKAEK
jgi:SAM-dependent methyltransferase